DEVTQARALAPRGYAARRRRTSATTPTEVVTWSPVKPAKLGPGFAGGDTRKYKATTDSSHRLTVAPNLLEQHFHAERPNEVWVSDITYLWTRQGWMYLAVILDLFSRKVVGWSLRER